MPSRGIEVVGGHANLASEKKKHQMAHAKAAEVGTQVVEAFRSSSEFSTEKVQFGEKAFVVGHKKF